MLQPKQTCAFRLNSSTGDFLKHILGEEEEYLLLFIILLWLFFRGYF